MPTPDSNAKFLAVDSSLVDLAEKKSSKSNNKTAYFTAEEIANTTTSGGYTYAEVFIPKIDILAMGTTPIELLAASGANKYYDIDQIILEYSKNTTFYSAGAADQLTIYQSSGRYISQISLGYLTGASFPSSTTERIIIARPQAYYGKAVDATEGLIDDLWSLNDNVVLTTLNAGDPTLGDGTILAKIWYKVKTFGTEL